MITADDRAVLVRAATRRDGRVSGRGHPAWPGAEHRLLQAGLIARDYIVGDGYVITDLGRAVVGDRRPAKISIIESSEPCTPMTTYCA